MNEYDLNQLAPTKARIEIIPLIDVIFFLLATFVLFTLSLQKIAVVEAPFAKSDVVPPQTLEDTTAYVQATDGGMFYWKIGRVSPAELIPAVELEPRLADYRHHTPKPRVFLRTDATARLSAGIVVLDAARKAGIRELSLETLTSATGS